MSQPAPTRHSTLTQALHWLTAVVVVIAFTYSPGGPEARVYAPARDFERHLHETLGMLVLTLGVLRLLWRLFDRRPEPEPGTRLMKAIAGTVQTSLFVLLFAVPVTAIAGAWLEGHAVSLLGGIHIPAPLPEYHQAGKAVAEIHTYLGDAILWIAGFHALAGIYHHFVLKDGVLRSMLPGFKADNAA